MIAASSSTEAEATLSATNQASILRRISSAADIGSTRISAEVIRTPGASASQSAGKTSNTCGSNGFSALPSPKIV